MFTLIFSCLKPLFLGSVLHEGAEPLLQDNTYSSSNTCSRLLTATHRIYIDLCLLSLPFIGWLYTRESRLSYKTSLIHLLSSVSFTLSLFIFYINFVPSSTSIHRSTFIHEGVTPLSQDYTSSCANTCSLLTHFVYLHLILFTRQSRGWADVKIPLPRRLFLSLILHTSQSCFHLHVFHWKAT